MHARRAEAGAALECPGFGGGKGSGPSGAALAREMSSAAIRPASESSVRRRSRIFFCAAAAVAVPDAPNPNAVGCGRSQCGRA